MWPSCLFSRDVICTQVFERKTSLNFKAKVSGFFSMFFNSSQELQILPSLIPVFILTWKLYDTLETHSQVNLSDALSEKLVVDFASEYTGKHKKELAEIINWPAILLTLCSLFILFHPINSKYSTHEISLISFHYLVTKLKI